MTWPVIQRINVQTKGRKSLFICVSCGFPFPIVHQVLSPPLSLAEWWGQQPLLVSDPSSSAGARPPSLLHDKWRRPLSPMRVQSSVRSNLQDPHSKYEVLQGSSTLHHSLPHAHVCKIQPEPGWHLHLVKHGSEGNGAMCQVGGYPRKALQCFCPSWAVELCWATPEISGWGGEMPAPCHCIVRDLWGQEEN